MGDHAVSGLEGLADEIHLDRIDVVLEIQASPGQAYFGGIGTCCAK